MAKNKSKKIWAVIQSPDWDKEGKAVKWKKLGYFNNILEATKVLSENATFRQNILGSGKGPRMKTLIVTDEDRHLFDGGKFGYAPHWLTKLFNWD